MQLVLSLFTGAGLLDKAFKEKGFCVVSAGDIILNNDICDFTGMKGKFEGVIGGPRCQDFSKMNRNRPDLLSSYGYKMLQEFKRVVLECEPNWALMENVAETPDLNIDDYSYQRIDINQSWYEDVNRLRHIQFYSKDNLYLHWDRKRDSTVLEKKCDGAALASDSRSFKELVRLQGLPLDTNFPDFTVKGKKKLVGNGVPLSIGRVLAKEVLNVTDPGNKFLCDSPGKNKNCDSAAQHIVTDRVEKRCKCDCKRIVSHRGSYYDYSCRKRNQRKNERFVK